MAGFRAGFGPAALITGVSDGIGCAFAKAQAARGLDLVPVARRKDALDAGAFQGGMG